MTKLYFALAFILFAAFSTIYGQENLTGSLPADSIAPNSTYYRYTSTIYPRSKENAGKLINFGNFEFTTYDPIAQ